MVQEFHQDQLEKTHFLIGYKNYLHQDEIPGPCQTRSIFSISFLLLYDIIAPKIFEEKVMLCFELQLIVQSEFDTREK